MVTEFGSEPLFVTHLLKGISLSSILAFFFFSLFWPHHVACRILVSRPGIEPTPPAVEALSLNRWTAKGVPILAFFKFNLDIGANASRSMTQGKYVPVNILMSYTSITLNTLRNQCDPGFTALRGLACLHPFLF